MKPRATVTAPALAAAVFALLTILGACTTTGEIPVELQEPRTIYISPANGDGVQDSARYPLNVTPLERTAIAQATVTVRDAGGTVVRREEETAPERRFLRRPEGVELFEVVLWDGRDDAGELVPDGEYTLVVEVRDTSENTGISPEQTIIVDNTPPSVELSAPFLFFTPNGDDRLDVLAIYQRRSTQEDRWSGTMALADGTTVREFAWQGGARDFTWDGTADSGADAPEGHYVYTVTATDRAGNTGTFTLTGIELKREPEPIALTLSRGTFSPNNDGRADTVMLYPYVTEPEEIIGWRIDIRDLAGQVLRTYAGDGVPAPLVFDGRNNAGEILEDGRYQPVFRAALAGGQEPETASPALVVDTQPPRATVRLSAQAFSPAGGGSDGTVVIQQSSSNEARWIGRFSNEAGTHVRSETWAGRVSNFEWDGTDQSGVLLPDGVYTYRLFTIDEGDNEAIPSVTRIRLDTIPPDVNVATFPPRFSPDGDGVDDMLRIAITATDAGTLQEWRAELLHPTGLRFVEWGGTGRPPESLRWDGRSDAGEVVQSAEVYQLTVTVTDTAGNTGVAREDVRVGILIEREGERLRIRISSIYFVPFTADYVNLDDPVQAQRNLETLDNLATVLEDYPEYTISIEGHAVSLLWEDPGAAQREQDQVLVPLSRSRADVIRDALAERDVDPARMTTVGHGGARPVVPHWDEDDRWKNRRVEFVLERE